MPRQQTLTVFCLLGLLLMGSAAVAPADEAAATKDAKSDAAKSEADAAKTDAAKSDETKTDAAKSDATKQAVKKVALATIAVQHDYPEGASGNPFLGGMSPSLRELIGRLDAAAKDDKIQGVVLRLREPQIGLGKADEVRAAIARVRKSGKRVYADLQSAVSLRDYLVAAACDQIIMPESGSLTITGVEAEVMFFKGLFDKLGIAADFVQIGDFKGASEPFTRTSMSPEFRKQYEAVIEDFYQHIAESIAQDRKLDVEQVKKLIDEGLFTAAGARAARLIDRVAYEDQWNDELKKEYSAEEIAWKRGYGREQSGAELGGMAGMMKFMEMLMGGDAKARSSSNDKIAVVYIVGPIMTGESAMSFFGGSTVGGDTIVQAMRQAENDAKVKAIVLRVDSPGGSALASDLIWREVTNSKKPVIVSMGDIAASGGYYVSMGADKIFVEPGTLTGSIGVVGGKLALHGLFDWIGISTETISRGKNSGTFSMNDGFTESQREAVKRLMLDIYKQFTSKAAEGRKMELAKLESLAAGRLFSGRMAVANGLADKLGTLDDAVAEAKNMAGISGDKKTDLLILPKPKNIFEQLFGGSAAETEVRAIAPELIDAARSAATLRRLFTEPAITIMPYVVKIK
ncbi:MAG: signal peptide peptidase SppA [Pirellulales bacterium]